MAETHLDAPVASPRTPVRHRVQSTADTLLGPLWRTTFRDPVRTGRLRLDGLSGPERQLARVGLVLLVLLLASLLFVDVWRRGDLQFLDLSSGPRFVPEGLVPVTLVAFFVAVLLVVWGAMDAAPVVRVVVAVVYVGTVAALGTPSGFGEDSWVLRHGSTVVRAAFAVPPAALLLSAALARLPRVTRWATPLLRLLSLLALATMLATMLWVSRDFRASGFTSILPLLVNTGFTLIDGLLIPLVVLAGIAVVDFATDVATSLAEPASRARARLRGLVVAAVLAVAALKLWTEVVQDRDYWSAYAERQPLSLVHTTAVVALLAVVCAVLGRLVRPGSDDAAVDEAKERLTLGGAAVIAAVPMVGIVLLGMATVVASFTGSQWGLTVARAYPTAWLSTWLPIAASVAALAGGLWLLRRGRLATTGGLTRELAVGLVVLGAWNVPAWVLDAAEVSWGFSYRLVDVLVTVGALVWLAVRGRRADVGQLAVVLAVLLFTWLVMSRGDYISFLGGVLGLPSLVVVVFGILYTLLSGAGFTTESSARLPRESRTLMFTGYVLVSVAILHWLAAVHLESDDVSLSGFYFVGIPLAAWLVARRIVPRVTASARG